MQISLLEKTDSAGLSPHFKAKRKCPICGGKVKYVNQSKTMYCSSCNFVGTEIEAIKKIEKDITAEPILFFCNPKAKSCCQKVRHYGYRSYFMVRDLVGIEKDSCKIFLTYDSQTTDHQFIHIANQLFPQFKDIMGLFVQTETLLSIENKENLDIFLKQALFSNYESILLAMGNFIKKLDKAQQDKIVNPFLSLSIYIKNPEVHPFAFDRLLEGSLDSIRNFLFQL